MRELLKILDKHGNPLLIELNFTKRKREAFGESAWTLINGQRIFAVRDFGSDYWEPIAGSEGKAQKVKKTRQPDSSGLGIGQLPPDEVRRAVRDFIRRNERNKEFNGYLMDYNGDSIWFGWDDATTWEWGAGRERGRLFEQDAKAYFRNQGRAVGVSVIFKG